MSTFPSVKSIEISFNKPNKLAAHPFPSFILRFQHLIKSNEWISISLNLKVSWIEWKKKMNVKQNWVIFYVVYKSFLYWIFSMQMFSCSIFVCLFCLIFSHIQQKKFTQVFVIELRFTVTTSLNYLRFPFYLN